MTIPEIKLGETYTATRAEGHTPFVGECVYTSEYREDAATFNMVCLSNSGCTAWFNIAHVQPVAKVESEA